MGCSCRTTPVRYRGPLGASARLSAGECPPTPPRTTDRDSLSLLDVVSAVSSTEAEADHLECDTKDARHATCYRSSKQI
jgi:hypothetical protein